MQLKDRQSRDMQAQTRKFFHKYPLAAPIAGSALLVLGGAAIFWLLNRNNFTPGTMPVGANIIPQDSLMVLSLNTDPEQWRQLRQFGTAKSQPAFDKALAQWRDQFLTANGIDYKRDIQPWVGQEVTIAQLSPQSELVTNDSTVVPSSLSPQPMVAVVPIADPLKAKELVGAQKEPPGRKWNERSHRDIKIREALPPEDATPGTPASQPMQFAVVDNKVLVVSNSARSMNRAIETYRDGKSLAQTPGYAQALGQIQRPVRPFATLYRNIPASVASASANFDKSLSKQNQEALNQNQGWATVADVKSEGVEFRSIAWLKPDSKRKFDVKNNSKTLPDRMPVETLAMFSGSDFQQFWQGYSRDVMTYPFQPVNPTVFSQGIQEALGMSWSEDFLPWMQGEFTLGLVPMPGDDAKKLPLGIVMMAQTNDRRKAEEAFKKLDGAMSSRQKYKVEIGKYNNEEVTNWNEPTTGTSVMRGWMDNNVTFFALGAPVAGTFFPQTRAPLGKDNLFRESTMADVNIQKNQQNANGYFFVNFDRLFSLSKLPPLFAWVEPYRDWLEAIRTIGTKSVITSDRTIRYDSFVSLKKSGNIPGTLPAPSLPKPIPSPSPKASVSPSPKSN
jgi:hypothetical protein